MILSLLFGFIAGIAAIIYRGVYFGPWNETFNTMATCLAAAIALYILLQILIGIGGFFLKVVFAIVVTILIVFGGTKIWNTYNPDNPINLPIAAKWTK